MRRRFVLPLVVFGALLATSHAVRTWRPPAPAHAAGALMTVLRPGTTVDIDRHPVTIAYARLDDRSQSERLDGGRIEQT